MSVGTEDRDKNKPQRTWLNKLGSELIMFFAALVVIGLPLFGFYKLEKILVDPLGEDHAKLIQIIAMLIGGVAYVFWRGKRNGTGN